MWAGCWLASAILVAVLLVLEGRRQRREAGDRLVDAVVTLPVNPPAVDRLEDATRRITTSSQFGASPPANKGHREGHDDSLGVMSDIDLEHPPEGVVVLSDDGAGSVGLDPRDWVETVRRPTPTRLDRRAADHLAEARELEEV